MVFRLTNISRKSLRTCYILRYSSLWRCLTFYFQSSGSSILSLNSSVSFKHWSNCFLVFLRCYKPSPTLFYRSTKSNIYFCFERRPVLITSCEAGSAIPQLSCFALASELILFESGGRTSFKLGRRSS